MLIMQRLKDTDRELSHSFRRLERNGEGFNSFVNDREKTSYMDEDEIQKYGHKIITKDI